MGLGQRSLVSPLHPAVILIVECVVMIPIIVLVLQTTRLVEKGTRNVRVYLEIYLYANTHAYYGHDMHNKHNIT